jgi:hypothetical protein
LDCVIFGYIAQLYQIPVFVFTYGFSSNDFGSKFLPDGPYDLNKTIYILFDPNDKHFTVLFHKKTQNDRYIECKQKQISAGDNLMDLRKFMED